MSTRSMIGILNENGTISAIYCHADGYVAHVGIILAMHYSTKARVNSLLKLGDLSALGQHHAPAKGKPHTFDNPQPDVTVAYHRDRGEKLAPAQTFANMDDYLTHKTVECIDYFYLFDDDAWFYSSPQTKPEWIKIEVKIGVTQ